MADEKSKSKTGRPRKLSVEDAKKAAEDYGKGEMSILEICKKYNIGERTWYQYLDPTDQRYFEHFEQLIKEAKQKRLDRTQEFAEQGLMKLLKGYEYEEVKTIIDPPTEEDGKGSIREVQRTKKQVKPDKTLIMFTLTNRAPRKWKHRSQVGLENVDDKPLKILDVSLDDIKEMDASSLSGMFDEDK